MESGCIVQAWTRNEARARVERAESERADGAACTAHGRVMEGGREDDGGERSA
jgi:hypothetical protein